MKKGNTSWKPASLNEFSNKEDGYRYRMARKDPDNLAKKKAESWEIVSDLQSNPIKHETPNRLDLGTPLTSVQEGRDWILMKIPEEIALQRDKHFNDRTERQTLGLTAHTKKEIGATGTKIHGEITISSRKRTQTIE